MGSPERGEVPMRSPGPVERWKARCRSIGVAGLDPCPNEVPGPARDCIARMLAGRDVLAGALQLDAELRCHTSRSVMMVRSGRDIGL